MNNEPIDDELRKMIADEILDKIPCVTVEAAATLLHVRQSTVRTYLYKFKGLMKPPQYRMAGKHRMRVLYVSDLKLLNSKTILRKYRKDMLYPDPWPVEIKRYG